jgi:hypothetical protein
MRRHCLPSLFASFAVCALLAPSAAGAQSPRVELSPFAGYRWGGELDSRDNDLFDQDVDVDESAVAGVRLEVAITDNFHVELLASRQATEFTTGDDDLFGDDRGLADVDIDTLQVGLLFQGGSGQVHPYGVIALGGTRLNPDVAGIDSEERLSGSAGGGVKLFVNRNIGFRFEGRVYWTDTEDEDDRDFHDDFDWQADGDLYQGEATVGLIVAF